MKSPFVHRIVFDGHGVGNELTEEMSDVWNNAEGIIWYHLDYSTPDAREWLDARSGLSELTIRMLVSDDTRPRITIAEGGYVICLRGVNYNPGSDPEDMISLRMWINEGKILTMRKYRVEAVNDVREALSAGDGPTDPGNFLALLSERLTVRIAEIVATIDEGVDDLEDEILKTERVALRAEILKYRRMVIGLRKYLIPQRDVLSRLEAERATWVSDMDRLRFHESAERTGRCIDDLDSARDRAAMAQEELNARLSEQMNQTIFMMSIVATIFLPLGLLTGLLGVNVGGMPGTESPWAFAIVCGILVAVAGILYWIFKIKQMIK